MALDYGWQARLLNDYYRQQGEDLFVAATFTKAGWKWPTITCWTEGVDALLPTHCAHRLPECLPGRGRDKGRLPVPPPSGSGCRKWWAISWSLAACIPSGIGSAPSLTPIRSRQSRATGGSCTNCSDKGGRQDSRSQELKSYLDQPCTWQG